MLITLMQLQAIMPAAGVRAVQFIDVLNLAMDEFNISTLLQQAAFLAQCAHESGQLRTIVENLNYSAEGLMKTFPKHFAKYGEATMYAKKPTTIASLVYAFKNGNGGQETGDGWDYRGRGLIQITGRANYRDCGEALGLDLEKNPELLGEPGPASRSAAWFWNKHNLNNVAGDIVKVTEMINGGHNGLQDRETFFDAAKSALGI